MVNFSHRLKSRDLWWGCLLKEPGITFACSMPGPESVLFPRPFWKGGLLVALISKMALPQGVLLRGAPYFIQGGKTPYRSECRNA